MSRPVIALTLGDVAGIGPEVVARALAACTLTTACRPLVIGHAAILRRAITLAGLENQLQIREVSPAPPTAEELHDLMTESTAGRVIPCWNPAGDEALSAIPGTATAAAGEAAYEYLVAAIDLARDGVIDAISTAPLNKEALHLAGHHVPGHTEILAQACGVQDFAMMLYLPESRMLSLRTLVGSTEVPVNAATSGLSIAHVTLHTSIASVPNLLTTDAVAQKIELMNSFLARIGCRRQSIGVCALNPHGGENGLFGDEESRIIEPAVRRCADSHVNVTGPLPVDTLVRRAFAGEFDGLIAMYHDQGHIPVKLLGFDSAVNITLGLPIVRTSPTHGTAFDRAWNPATPADASGMIEAVVTAARLSNPGTGNNGS